MGSSESDKEFTQSIYKTSKTLTSNEEHQQIQPFISAEFLDELRFIENFEHTKPRKEIECFFISHFINSLHKF